jgi:hypothetical protein
MIYVHKLRTLMRTVDVTLNTATIAAADTLRQHKVSSPPLSVAITCNAILRGASWCVIIQSKGSTASLGWAGEGCGLTVVREVDESSKCWENALLAFRQISWP